ncbi:MAG TPA: hypothetical protein VK419_06140 [Bryobacteraceae bacterium]|nr:hypothetical protein [Bryobacteraceae bacterium]
MTVARYPALLSASLLMWLTMLIGFAAGQEPPPAPPATKQADTFFAGSVTELTPEKISVSRKLSGKTENRSFRITPDTKVEGKLKMRVRVTVRYVTDEAGDTAMLIVVRTAQQKK